MPLQKAVDSTEPKKTNSSPFSDKVAKLALDCQMYHPNSVIIRVSICGTSGAIDRAHLWIPNLEKHLQAILMLEGQGWVHTTLSWSVTSPCLGKRLSITFATRLYWFRTKPRTLRCPWCFSVSTPIPPTTTTTTGQGVGDTLICVQKAESVNTADDFRRYSLL